MISKRVCSGIVVLGLLASASAFAGKRDRWQTRPQPSSGQGAQAGQSAEPKTEVDRYLVDSLGVENPADYDMTRALEQRLEKLPAESKANLDWLFSQQSSPALGQIFRGFGRTEYNNAMVLGPAGSGKSFLMDQIVALFSMGKYPEFMKNELGQDGTYQIQRDALLGQTDVVLINSHLLALDNTPPGKAFASQEMRIRSILTDLFKAARDEFNKTDGSGKRIGRRTIFIFDEVATLPELVQQSMKKILDSSGFKNPNDPVKASADSGFMVMAMTTPDEYRVMVNGESAIERRYFKVPLTEPTEDEAFRIVRGKTDREWTPLYGLKVSDDAIRFLIRMRRIITSPPLAMPASVLAATNDLLLSGIAPTGSGGELSLKDAQKFITGTAKLSDVWFEGPNGEPPFHDLSERLKARVIGQDEVVEKVADRLKAWARLNFGGEVPIFFLGGSSGSGKDTLVKALNEVLFGQDRPDLMFAMGSQGFSEIVEGSSDGEQGLLVRAMENGSPNGIITFNEGKDAPNKELEKLKVFVERGEIRPKGKDARARPLRFPVFILGQWGEELFFNKTDKEISDAYAGLNQAQIEQMFLGGKAELPYGAVSRALLDRAKKSGGVFMLKPVARQLYPQIVDISLQSVRKSLKAHNNIDLTVAPALAEFVAKTSIDAGEGTRGLGATLIDFTETAISRAIDQKLPMRDVAVSLDYEHTADNRDLVVVKSAGQTWKFDTTALRRIKVCEAKLIGL